VERTVEQIRGVDMNRMDIHERSQQPTGQEERTSTRGAGREARGEKAGMDMARLREAGRNLGTQLEEHVHKRPYIVIGAAAGVGFVAGSLLGSRLGQLLLAAGIGYVAKNLLEGDIGMDRIQEGIERLAHERGRG
jgi:ElaB/YqjD/DUF883 family membrane-anchored ribosome-binding protein